MFTSGFGVEGRLCGFLKAIVLWKGFLVFKSRREGEWESKGIQQSYIEIPPCQVANEINP